jgi:hypothetical protein
MAPRHDLDDSGDMKPSNGGVPLMLAGPSVEIASHSGLTPARVSTVNEGITSGDVEIDLLLGSRKKKMKIEKVSYFPLITSNNYRHPPRFESAPVSE